ncbi:hypothetical protein C5167_015235 [Papaver somniferum]|uniref:Uncharacterized protein n=1 Tax=Papaver somniferum TaxID=3469 RepID=A0A4Y7J9I5_PAPSO|nr:hypothetical protein C5167_015235 [Papaver somniferum]
MLVPGNHLDATGALLCRIGYCGILRCYGIGLKSAQLAICRVIYPVVLCNLCGSTMADWKGLEWSRLNGGLLRVAAVTSFF